MAAVKHAVTGAFGFSGGFIATRLLGLSREVITLTSSTRRESPLQGKLAVYPFDFEHPERMAQSLAGVDVLYNTYWTRLGRGETSHEGAVQNSRALFKAARLAGVRRVVHISVAGAGLAPSLSYYRAKGEVEEALALSGLSYSILRPAMLFGPGGVLVNNMAWMLRRLPVFAIFGAGGYKLEPIYVDDLAALAVAQGEVQENTVVYALGPDIFTYKDFVRTLGKIIGHPRPLVPVPLWAGLLGSWFIGRLQGDVFASREELKALMSGLLHVPGEAATGTTRFADWARANAGALGREYISEIGRRRDKSKAY